MPPLAAQPREGKYKEFFICAPQLPLAAFRLFASRTKFFQDISLTNVTSSTAVQTRGGSFEEGLANGHKLLGSHPAVALQQAQTLLRGGPEARAFALAAAALRRLGRVAEAEQAELSAINASFAVRELEKVAIAGQDGRDSEARTALEHFLAAQPENLLALTMAAEMDMADWQLDAAEQRLRGVLERAPSFLRAAVLLIDCLRLQPRLGEAIALAEEVVARKPDNLIVLRKLADLLAEGNRQEEAAKVYKRLLELDGKQLQAWIIYAHMLRMLGRKDESEAAFRSALAVDPNSGAAWWALANYFPSKLSDADVATMKRVLEAQADSPQNGGPLHIALGRLAEQRGDHSEAFRHIAEGKRLRASAHPDESAENSANVEELIRRLTPERFAAAAGAGCTSDAPIFIIGMPRSGTTLLERILSRHSAIEAAGELPVVARLAAATGNASPDRIAALGPDEMTRLGEAYLERAGDYRAGDKPHFIDKMNPNWFRVGLIRMMLPNARIIDLRRDALDCCWSNFKMMFAEGNVAANDQRRIARFYRDYVRMVEAVDAAAPGGILKVRYEELVDDVEGQTRRILEFLGLDYEAQCIDFHLASEAVATPSSEQVRRPINRDSIGSAQPYREWLGPMIEELGELAR
jgi:tetratricopeptide (TPR) repeat protein